MNTRLLLDTRSRAKDGKGAIVIMIYHNGTNARIPLGQRVSPSEWNGQSVVRRPDAVQLNAFIADRKGRLDRDLAALQLAVDISSMTAVQLKDAVLNRTSTTPGKHSVRSVADSYLNKDLKPKTRDQYEFMVRKLEKFAGEGFAIEDITRGWLYEFQKHMDGEGLAVNTRGHYLRALSTLCNYSVGEGYMQVSPFANFTIRKSPSLNDRTLDIGTLRSLWDVDRSLLTDRQSLFLDYFFIQFFLIGANIVDVVSAMPDQLVDGRFEYRRAKTGKLYSVKVWPECQRLIDRRRGERHLLEAMDHVKDPVNFRSMMNRSLRSVTRVTEDGNGNLVEVPVVDGLSTYYARHTWSTLASEDLGYDPYLVSKALGHAYGMNVTRGYIKQDMKVVDDMNRSVIDYVLMKGAFRK